MRNVMDPYGRFIQEEAIQYKRRLPGPIERVWAYLTEPEKRKTWLAGGEMELKKGGRVELIFDHNDLSPHEDPVPEKYAEHSEGSRLEGVITQIDPPRLLSYTWGESAGFDSEVTFELTPDNDEVLLTVTHRKLGDDRDMLIGISAGWHTHLSILTERLHGRDPHPFWSVHMDYEREYEQRIGDRK